MSIPTGAHSDNAIDGSGMHEQNGTTFIQTHEAWQRMLAEKRPMIVMFTSKLCGACKLMKGPYSTMKSYLPKDFMLAVVDLDQSDRAITLSALGQVAFVPAFQIYCDGNRVDYFIANHEDMLREKIDKVKNDLKQKEHERTVQKPNTSGHHNCFGGLMCLWHRR
mmetsp:Transcript_23165/g.72898  ORF Transcript_23165/g.72898 Transcript_23165/m.72898 type:complete len:164 (-) Transcript_23165:55-546(-)